MCWSGPASLAFGAIHTAIAALLIIRRRPIAAWPFYVAFCVFYAVMEFLQAFQWFWLDLDDLPLHIITTSSSYRPCAAANTATTILAYVLIWLQPVLFSSIGLFSSSTISKVTTMRFAVSLSVITCVVALLSLGLRFEDDRDARFTTFVPGTNYGNETCTYRGHIHLAWIFAVKSISYQPTHFVYVLLILVTVLHYEQPRLKWTLLSGWLLTLFLSILIVGTGAQLASFWCMTSVFAGVPILLQSLYSL